MNTAEIIVGKMKRDSGLQMRQLLAVRIGQPRKTQYLRQYLHLTAR